MARSRLNSCSVMVNSEEQHKAGMHRAHLVTQRIINDNRQTANISLSNSFLLKIVTSWRITSGSGEACPNLPLIRLKWKHLTKLRIFSECTIVQLGTMDHTIKTRILHHQRLDQHNHEKNWCTPCLWVVMHD